MEKKERKTSLDCNFSNQIAIILFILLNKINKRMFIYTYIYDFNFMICYLFVLINQKFFFFNSSQFDYLPRTQNYREKNDKVNIIFD